MNKLTYIFLAAAGFVTLQASAQVKVGDNPTNINSSAAFEVESTNKGLLLPRLTSAQRTAIASPTVGLVVFDTTTSTIWFYSPVGWYNTANPDATTLIKGVLRLSGDLTGTADSPAVAANAITTTKLADGAVTAAKLNQIGATASQTLKWNGTAWAPAADDNTTYTAGSGITLTGTSFAANDATTTTKGIVQLAGDITGTAAAPAIATGAVTSTKILDATVANADLAAGVGGIYKGSGSLSAGTTVALGTNVLAFTSTATTGTAHFKIDGTTFNVDAVNARVGLGTAAPAARLDVQGPRADYAAGTGANSDTPTNAIITAARGSNRYNDWPNTWYGGLSTFDILGSSGYFNNYYTRSDRKLKTNIKTMAQDITASYMKIRPVTYNLKNEVPGAEGLQYGFIAQEVAEIFPSIVTTTTDPVNGTIGMNYQALISPTVYMVQQQQQEIERLKKEVEDLKAAVKQLMENKK